MTEGDFFSANQTGVASGESFVIEPSTGETNAVEIHTIAGTGSADVFKEIDVAGDGTYSLSITVDSVNSASQSWHSQNNKIELSDTQAHRLRVINTDSGSRDYHASGIEILD